MDNRVLLHTCCAVCYSHPNNLLSDLGYEVIPYFYNPNIYPEGEHFRRFEELKKIASNVIYEEFSPSDFYDIAKGLEACPERGERCLKCFELRLLKTARKAQELGIKKFTTTLTVSPHKNSSQIFEVGKRVQDISGIEFLPIDFKKKDGFKITQRIADELGLYKQTYCGCEFSIRN